jgi:hypothetical protein
MNIKKLIVIVGDESESLQKGLVAFSVSPESIGQPAYEAAEEAVKKFPSEIKDHHVRHFFTKINKGTHAVGHYVGKVVTTQPESIDYLINTVGRAAFGQNFLLHHFIKDFEYYKNGVYSCVATPEEAVTLKKEVGSDAITFLASRSPMEGKYDFQIDVSSKAKMKKDLLTIMQNLKQRWT